ncbi:CRISPR-associated RAMP protein Csx10 [Dolichospermum sp. ST_sed9]|nr:CRISPR-associated RAMP protein Csx10 [Dolichospermum sp. ST_sed9]
MKAITFQFHTEQPVLATSFQGDPNSDVSYPYIPGSMIRGALIGRYLKSNPSENADIINDENIRDLFFNGKTRYLNAYLLTQGLDQYRTLPTPLSWFKDKGDEIPKEIYDLSGMELKELPKNVSPKKLTDSFCTVSDRTITTYNVKKRINIHNQRHRSRGRSTEETGEIFRYEAIDKGQTFQGIVLCDYTDTKTIETLLQQDKNLWLGGSQSAGYGHTIIDINNIKIHNTQNSKSWNEIEIKIDQRLNRKTLQVTLLSDLIFQNDYGQYTVESPTKLLAEVLKLEEEQLKEHLRKSYIGNTVIGGFNRKWGLPLPQIQALKAGSVFVFDNLQLSSEQIFNLEWQGIGERRFEGFGRIAVNWLNLDKGAIFDGEKPNQDKYSTETVKLEENSAAAKLAKKMAQRLLRQKLDDLLMEQVGRTDLQGSIRNNQLSRLIIVARQALYENCDLELIKNLLDNLPSNSSKQFEKAESQIRYWIEKPENWLGSPTVNIAGETCSLNEELKKEYTLRLIMAVAKKAKENNND